MKTFTYQDVHNLKVAGHYVAAGALARELKLDRHYGCHFGMKSSFEGARLLFYRGYDSAGK